MPARVPTISPWVARHPAPARRTPPMKRGQRERANPAATRSCLDRLDSRNDSRSHTTVGLRISWYGGAGNCGRTIERSVFFATAFQQPSAAGGRRRNALLRFTIIRCH